jgi:MSHA pilin protein MshC
MSSPPDASTLGRSGASERGGFTIIEAVVLISIVGIMGAVAAPRFLAMSEMDATHAHREALGDLRFAQRLAANSGCPVQVDFDSGGYVLTRRTGCRSGSFTQALVDPTSNQAPFAVTLPAGVTVSSTVDPLVFDALGRASTTAGVVSDATITVGTQSLQAIGETGLVRVP